MEFSPILILLLLWLFIGLPIKKLNELAKKSTTAKAKPRAGQPAPSRDQGPAPEAEPVRPSVMQPTIRVTPHDDSIYQGSLNAVTGEGYDPCHDEQMSSLTQAESILPAAEPAAPGLQLGWTGSDIVRGFVMGEILKRK